MHMRIIAGTALLCALSSGAFAQGEIVEITPHRHLTEEERIERMGMNTVSTVMLVGAGETVEISYTATHPLSCDTGPLRSNGKGDPQHLVRFALPAGSHRASIDLTTSPGWAPWSQNYLVACMGTAGSTAELGRAVFTSARLTTIVRVARKHLRLPEEYQASSAHTLRGYRIVGIPLGYIVLAAALFGIFLMSKLRRERALSRSLAIVLVCALGYQAWFSMDLVTMTAMHLRTWASDGTYAQLGSVEEIAHTIRREAEARDIERFVLVCTSESDFYEKALRYFLYPSSVSRDPESLAAATFIVVHAQPGWYEEDGVLHCGRVEGPARFLQKFPDGSVLFAITR